MSKKSDEIQKELDKLAVLEQEIKAVSNDINVSAPVKEEEPQTKLSQNELRNAQEIYLKPIKTQTSREKFNERFRDEWNHKKEYVRFIAEHKELIGEVIDKWTKPFPGVPAEEWLIPTNKPVWGPRYLAESLANKTYNRLTMDEAVAIEGNRYGTITGQLTVTQKIKRLDAYPATTARSVFM